MAHSKYHPLVAHKASIPSGDSCDGLTNLYSAFMPISPTLSEMQKHGFPIGGETSVALDLVDTVANAHTMPTDLFASNANAWWDLQSGRLPESETPSVEATQRLRAILREVFEASIDDSLASGTAVDELNRFADSVHSSLRLEIVGREREVATSWHITREGNPRLAAIAHDAITVLGDPARSGRLRRCANPTCSMIFLAENPRRVWCASNICGNRARVARHQQRQKEQPEE
jgi:predicted RNA-binding Zn ribbon-like protein